MQEHHPPKPEGPPNQVIKYDMPWKAIGASMVIGFLIALALILFVSPAQAATPGSLSVKGAHRAAVKARVEYREAVRVYTATKFYSRHDYSDFAGREVNPVPVGRWVSLARQVGWPWSCIDPLMHIIARESSGSPGVVNPASGCTGLLQVLPSNCSAPHRLTNPRYNLKIGLRLYWEAGWQPWFL